MGKTWEKHSIDTLRCNLLSIDFDPNNPNIVYAAGYLIADSSLQGIVYKSDDGGKKWKKTYEIPKENAIGTESSYYLNKVFFDPSNSNTLYLSGTYGLLKSNDGGISWNVVQKGNYYSLCATQNGVLSAVVDYKNISQSNDGGLTWNTIFEIEQSELLRVRYDGKGNRLLVGSASGLYTIQLK